MIYEKIKSGSKSFVIAFRNRAAARGFFRQHELLALQFIECRRRIDMPSARSLPMNGTPGAIFDLYGRGDQPQTGKNAILRFLKRWSSPPLQEVADPPERAFIVEGVIDGLIFGDEGSSVRIQNAALKSVKPASDPVRYVAPGETQQIQVKGKLLTCSPFSGH